jgi:hypothetical protein
MKVNLNCFLERDMWWKIFHFGENSLQEKEEFVGAKTLEGQSIRIHQSLSISRGQVSGDPSFWRITTSDKVGSRELENLEFQSTIANHDHWIEEDTCHQINHFISLILQRICKR